MKSLQDILIERALLTHEQLESVKRDVREQRMQLEEYLIRHSIVPPHALAEAIATAYSLPFVGLITEKMAQPDILAQVPLRFLREHAVIPIRAAEGRSGVTIVTDQPGKFEPLDELRLIFGQNTSLAVAQRSVIIEAINKFYPLEGEKQMIADLAQAESPTPDMDFGEINEEDILGMASEAPIIKLVNHIFYQAIKRGASDIHIEPFEREVVVRYRIDGMLHEVMTPPKRAQLAIISRIKIMAHLNIAEKQKPQGGRIQLKAANKAMDIRVSVLPVVYGERVVMRLLDKTRTFTKLEDLGLSTHDYEVLLRSIEQPNGIILMTGPTGSGKTSTLYAILSRLNKESVNIITVEDPVEYQMKGIGQVQVREKIGLTFALALREILRQDPDIVMIGETRDTETAQIAIQAALTGHLVLSTLHTNSAAATVTRLVDMGVEPFLIASTLVCVIAQRLVRRLCDVCKVKGPLDKSVVQLLGVPLKGTEPKEVYQPKGCDECLHTGFRGRLPIFEIMSISPTLARLITNRADTRVIQKQAQEDGMTLLAEDGWRKVLQGLTTAEEVLSEATMNLEEGA